MGRMKVKFWNFLTRVRKSSCDPEKLLILIPTCLQNSECTRKITTDVERCKRCGKCKVKDVLEVSDRYGTKRAVATGGRLALNLAKGDDVEAVVAIACEEELQEGLKGVFPKPALGIVNIRPHGPCKDTDVEIEELEEAIEKLTE